jgi:RNA polymerase sigma-70 factor (ECF subfamily)
MSFPSSIWTTILSLRNDPEGVKETVIRRYREPVFEYIRRQGIRHEDAEDLTQNVFLRITKDSFLERVDPRKGKFRTLLLTVTRNVVASFRRHELAAARDHRRTVPLDDHVDVPAESPADAEFDRLWVRNLVTQAMDRLPKDRPLLALKLQLEGKSYQEIAQALGKSETDVTNYIHRAKKLLRQEIEQLIAEYSGSDVKEEIANLLQYL